MPLLQGTYYQLHPKRSVKLLVLPEQALCSSFASTKWRPTREAFIGIATASRRASFVCWQSYTLPKACDALSSSSTSQAPEAYVLLARNLSP